MSIITQCPGCGTTFRVTPPQLQAQHGMVRCGRCANVFDGFKTLATLPEATLPDVTLPDITLPEITPDEAAEVVEHSPRAAAVTAAPAADAVSPPALAAATAPPDDAAATAPHPFVSPRVATPDPPSLELFAVDSPATRRRSGGWAFGALLLFFVLAAQGAYFFRSDIAAAVPEARPYLGKMCELLHCAVALPQRPRQISIEASDMQATDPARPGLVALTATLRNHATIELGYPALDVVLTNSKEHTVARRIFLPAEYLVAGKDPRAGIAPNAEVTVRLDVETGDLGASGFRLDLLPAPAR